MQVWHGAQRYYGQLAAQSDKQASMPRPFIGVPQGSPRDAQGDSPGMSSPSSCQSKHSIKLKRRSSSASPVASAPERQASLHHGVRMLPERDMQCVRGQAHADQDGVGIPSGQSFASNAMDAHKPDRLTHLVEHLHCRRVAAAVSMCSVGTERRQRACSVGAHSCHGKHIHSPEHEL